MWENTEVSGEKPSPRFGHSAVALGCRALAIFGGQGVAVEDFDSDGIYDIFLPQRGVDELFLGTEAGTYVSVTGVLVYWMLNYL